MANAKVQTKKKRGRPPLSAAKKMRRNLDNKRARLLYKTLRAKIALLKVDFKEKLKLAAQEASQKVFEKVVKLERKRMEANYRALALAKAKVGKGLLRTPKQMSGQRRRGRPAQLGSPQGGVGIRRRGRPRRPVGN